MEWVFMIQNIPSATICLHLQRNLEKLSINGNTRHRAFITFFSELFVALTTLETFWMVRLVVRFPKFSFYCFFAYTASRSFLLVAHRALRFSFTVIKELCKGENSLATLRALKALLVPYALKRINSKRCSLIYWFPTLSTLYKEYQSKKQPQNSQTLLRHVTIK